MTTKLTPFDFINSISQSKKNLLDEDPFAVKQYNAWIINKGLSYFHDTIEYANDMNLYYDLDPDLQFSFLINIVRPRKRFSKWHKQKKDSDLQAVMKVYGYNITKAKEALSILNDTQLDKIRKIIDEGNK